MNPTWYALKSLTATHITLTPQGIPLLFSSITIAQAVKNEDEEIVRVSINIVIPNTE